METRREVEGQGAALWDAEGPVRVLLRAAEGEGEGQGGVPTQGEGGLAGPGGDGGGGSGSRPARTHVQDDRGAPARRGGARAGAGVRCGDCGGQRRPGLAHPGAHPAQQPAQRPALRRRLPEQPVRAGPAQARRPLAHRAAPAAATARKPADPRPARGPPPRDPFPGAARAPRPPALPPSAPAAAAARGLAGARGREWGRGRTARTPSHVPRGHSPHPPRPGAAAGRYPTGAGSWGSGCGGASLGAAPPSEGAPPRLGTAAGAGARCPASPERPLPAPAPAISAHARGVSPHHSAGTHSSLPPGARPVSPPPPVEQRPEPVFTPEHPLPLTPRIHPPTDPKN